MHESYYLIYYKISFKIFSILGYTILYLSRLSKINRFFYYEKSKKINNTIGSIYYNIAVSHYKIDDYSNALKKLEVMCQFNILLS